MTLERKNLGCFTKLRPRFVQARLRWDGSRAKEGGASLAHAPLGRSVTASTEGRRFRRCLDEGCLGAELWTPAIDGGACVTGSSALAGSLGTMVPWVPFWPAPLRPQHGSKLHAEGAKTFVPGQQVAEVLWKVRSA